MDEEEQKEFLYPKNDYRINKFSMLTTEEQLQAIQIGTIMRNVSIDEAKRIVTGKHDQERDNLSERYLEQIDILRSQLNRLKGEKEDDFLISDISKHGCGGGTVGELIYYYDINKFYLF